MITPKANRLIAEFALRDARAGHFAPLIGRVRSAAPLLPEERQFIAEALHRLDGRRGKAELRKIEKALIAQRVDGLVEEGKTTDDAVRQVERERKRKRATIYAALKAESKRK